MPPGALKKVCIRLYYRLPKGDPRLSRRFPYRPGEPLGCITSMVEVRLQNGRLGPPFQVRVQSSVDKTISNWRGLGPSLRTELHTSMENKVAGIMAENKGFASLTVEDWRGVVETLGRAFLNWWSTQG